MRPDNSLKSMRMLILLSCMLLAAAIGCAPTAEEQLPAFARTLIVQLEAEPIANPPASIWQYNYKDEVVFYVPPSCCDVPGALYSSDGGIICGPDGGITGKGDGKCPDFFDERTDERRIWLDSR